MDNKSKKESAVSKVGVYTRVSDNGYKNKKIKHVNN